MSSRERFTSGPLAWILVIQFRKEWQPNKHTCLVYPVVDTLHPEMDMQPKNNNNNKIYGENECAEGQNIMIVLHFG